MSVEPASTQPVTTSAPEPRRVPTERIHHGDTFVDEFAWLADKENPDTIAYLEAENAYTEAMTAGQAELREAIFGEIKARTQQADLSVPVRKGGWWYYARTEAGRQYQVYCRRAVRPDDAGPPMTADGAPLDGEEILLDANELAGDGRFFSLGAYDVSPDGRRLAYSTDFAGSERFTLRVKDLVTGVTAPDQIPDTFHGSAWSADGSAVFYVTVDDAWRPYRVWRHMVGTRGRRRCDRLRGAGRALLGRCRPDPQPPLPGDLRHEQADQRGPPAGRRRARRRVRRRGAPQARRGIRG